jgi:hypothetical protein
MKKSMLKISTAEHRRLKRLDDRQNKMKPLILQLAAFVRTKKKKSISTI